MLQALIHHVMVFLSIFFVYSSYKTIGPNDDEYAEKAPKRLKPCELSSESKSETSLAVVYQWTIHKEYLQGVIIHGRFEIGEYLGGGYTGFVHSGFDLKSGDEVAVKFSTEETFDSLEKEFENYLYLGADDPFIVQHGIPHIIHFGDFGGYKILVMTKTGPTLSALRRMTKHHKFEITTICKIAIQGIHLFEYIHSRGLVFQDVKPLNMAIGNTNENQIFFFDFSFSEFYVNALGEPKKREETDNLQGTPDYMAWGPLNGFACARKDDLIAFGVVLLRLNNAYLPWMDETDDDTDIETAMQIVREDWEMFGIEGICNGSDHPKLFIDYFNYLDSLSAQDRPDYDKLVDIFAEELTNQDRENEELGIFDEDEDLDKLS